MLWGPPSPGDAIVPLAILTMLARATPPAPVRHVFVNLHSIVLLASVPLVTPSGAMMVHAIGALWRYRTMPSRAVFNAAGPVVGVFLAALALVALDVPMGASATSSGSEIALEMLVLTGVLAVSNAASLITVLRLTEGRPVRSSARNLVPRVALGYVGYGVAAFLVVLLWSVVGLGWFSVLLVLPSLMLAQWALMQYVDEADAYEVLLAGLVEALDTHVPGSRARSRLCADVARAVAESLRLRPDDVDTVVSVARLHDIGLLELPGGTVSSGRHEGACAVDRSSAAALLRHPEVSASMLGEVSFLADALPGICAHHERFDGSGYPDGLAGEQIPLTARIVAVADAWASLVHPRDGSRPLRPRAALEQCRRWSGTALDPRCVEALDLALSRQPAAFVPDVPGMPLTAAELRSNPVDHAHPDCTAAVAALALERPHATRGPR